jgi:hypothetical protein
MSKSLLNSTNPKRLGGIARLTPGSIEVEHVVAEVVEVVGCDVVGWDVVGWDVTGCEVVRDVELDELGLLPLQYRLFAITEDEAMVVTAVVTAVVAAAAALAVL